jgi:predicted flap endonuclease-1-like 5' DNA nuclease
MRFIWAGLPGRALRAADVCFARHTGLKSDIAPVRNCNKIHRPPTPYWSPEPSLFGNVREDYVDAPGSVTQTSGPVTSIHYGNGVPSAEADDTTIDMKPQQEPSTQEVLAGLVERVTFHNDDNGFCVLRIKARAHRELITVVGHAAAISAGEWVTASGEWINDHTHGKQFKARFMRTSAPTSIDCIEKYLGSGMIRGIGPVYAKKLVRAFGEKVFDTIEAEPDRLREVTGIGPVRAKRITDAWAEQKIVREIMVFLHSQSGQNRSRPTKLNMFCSRWAAQPKADSKTRRSPRPPLR